MIILPATYLTLLHQNNQDFRVQIKLFSFQTQTHLFWQSWIIMTTLRIPMRDNNPIIWRFLPAFVRNIHSGLCFPTAVLGGRHLVRQFLKTPFHRSSPVIWTMLNNVKLWWGAILTMLNNVKQGGVQFWQYSICCGSSVKARAQVWAAGWRGSRNLSIRRTLLHETLFFKSYQTHSEKHNY